ncbi:MAG: Chaperone protein HtpG [Chlamydiales bacterium]|nr:Chaperone protein HtpG [Chlamydiales bacterium]
MGKLKIHSENILPIIKKWLYSDKDIFVRELVSNSCDAISKLRKLTNDANETWRIDIKIDKENRTLTFSDNGLGMNHDEVETYISQIAFSGAEEFIQKYQSDKEEDQIIGHFGLGFYSAYMVAQNVEIQTLSHKDGADPMHWSCDGSVDYTLEKGSRETRGTDVVLHLSKEEDEYLDDTRLRQILHHYCSFLPYPIFLNDKQINEKPPLWMKPASECTEQEYLDFYRHLFPMEPDPLFWVHLNVDFPFNLKGILYFPKLAQDGELKKETIQLFCNRVFVSDNCRDLLPEYLTILRGAIDSPDIPLNVSRSYLQMDRTVRQLGSHISKKITDRLAALYRSEKEKFLTYWEDIELIVKFGTLQDEKFYERAKEFLVWKNSDQEWVTLEDYRERHPDQPIYYTSEEGHFLNLYREKGIEVLFIRPSMIDQALIQFLEKQTHAKFKRIDSGLDEKILDPSKEKGLLDAEGRSEAAKLAEFFHKKLDVEVEAKSLASESMPAFLMLKEEERRMRDSMAYHSRGASLPSFIKPTFVINTNNKLINAIHSVEQNDPELAKQMAHAVYDLACLSQKEMEPESMSGFIARSTEVLEKLALKGLEGNSPE